MRISDWSSDVCSSDLQIKQNDAYDGSQNQAAYEHRLARWRLQDDLALAGLLAAQGRSVRVLIPFVLRIHRPLLSAVTTRSARARFLFSVVPLDAIGTSSCRERGCTYVLFAGAPVPYKKQKTYK